MVVIVWPPCYIPTLVFGLLTCSGQKCNIAIIETVNGGGGIRGCDLTGTAKEGIY